MEIKAYTADALDEIARLFYDTVHTVNARDYTPAQQNAWATGAIDAAAWDKSLSAHVTRLAYMDGILVGFADLEGGYLDRLYVHKDYQRRKIASRLVTELEQVARQNGAPVLVTHASITARPFFEKRGYRMVRAQSVQRNGEILTNFIMELVL